MMIDALYYHIDEPVLFFVLGVVISACVCCVLFFFMRRWFRARLIRIEQRMVEIEQEFEPIKQRNQSSLRVFRQVVDGIDDVVQNVKHVLDEEEEKVKIVTVDSAYSSVSNLVDSEKRK